MTTPQDEANLNYAEKAFIAFNKIMSHDKRHMLENMNRANKGELFVLHFLNRSDVPVLPSQLSIALHASTARISALLGSLEKKGQIEREIDKSNRRNILVTITEAGREYVKGEMSQLKTSMTKVFEEMGEEETAEFIRLTKRFFELSHKYKPCHLEKDEN